MKCQHGYESHWLSLPQLTFIFKKPMLQNVTQIILDTSNHKYTPQQYADTIKWLLKTKQVVRVDCVKLHRDMCMMIARCVLLMSCLCIWQCDEQHTGKSRTSPS